MTDEHLVNRTPLVRRGCVPPLSAPQECTLYRRQRGWGGVDNSLDGVRICILKRESFAEMQLLVSDCTSPSSIQLR